MRLREWQLLASRLETDLDRLYALDQSCFAPGIAYTRAELAGFLAHPSAFCVLLEGARSPTELHGFAIGRTLRSRGKPVLHIITIDVAPSVRRQGAGTQLMGWLAAKAHALQLRALRLEVAVNNADALRFYERQGFVEVGRIEGYYLGSIDALILEKRLEP